VEPPQKVPLVVMQYKRILVPLDHTAWIATPGTCGSTGQGAIGAVVLLHRGGRRHQPGVWSVVLDPPKWKRAVSISTG